MYLNNCKLKASTVYQFPPPYLNPGVSGALTFRVKWFRDITKCPNFAEK